MRVVPTDNAVELAASFRELLQKRCPPGPSDSFYANDWSEFWDELVQGGWTQMGREFATSAPYDDVLVDLVPMSEVWGEYLIPLPFSEAVLVGVEGDQAGAVGVVTTGSTVWMAFADRLLAKGAPTALRVDAFAPSRPIGEYDTGDYLSSTRANDAIAVLWASEAVGCAKAALQRAVTYSEGREAYGRLIGSFQAVKHILADMLVATELARTGALAAAQDPEQRWAVAGDVLVRCRETIQGAIQVHGGMGFTWETGLHYYLRHVMTLEKLLRLRDLPQRATLASR